MELLFQDLLKTLELNKAEYLIELSEKLGLITEITQRSSIGIASEILHLIAQEGRPGVERLLTCLVKNGYRGMPVELFTEEIMAKIESRVIIAVAPQPDRLKYIAAVVRSFTSILNADQMRVLANALDLTSRIAWGGAEQNISYDLASELCRANRYKQMFSTVKLLYPRLRRVAGYYEGLIETQIMN